MPCLKDDTLPGGWILLSSLSSIQTHKGKKKKNNNLHPSVFAWFLTPGGKRRMYELRLLGCGEERAPCKPWAAPCPPASSEAQSSHPCDLQAGEPSGAFRRADVVHLHPRRPGGGQAVVSRSPHLGKSEQRCQAGCYGPWSPLLSQSHQRCQRTGSGCSKALTVDE